MKKRSSILLVISMIVLAALSRLLPHPPNVTPLAAMGLFGAYYLNKKWMTYVVLFAALFLSDFILNNTILRANFPDTEGLVLFSKYMIGVYLGFLAIILIGKKYLNSIKPNNLIGVTLISSLVFFVVTNLGSWAFSPFYTKDIAGLISCYVAGIPFFMNSIAGNLFFVGVLFGSVHWITKLKPSLAT